MSDILLTGMGRQGAACSAPCTTPYNSYSRTRRWTWSPLYDSSKSADRKLSPHWSVHVHPSRLPDKSHMKLMYYNFLVYFPMIPMFWCCSVWVIQVDSVHVFFFIEVDLSVLWGCSVLFFKQVDPSSCIGCGNLYSVQALLFLQEEYVACHQIITMALDKDHSDSNFGEADNYGQPVETVYSN